MENGGQSISASEVQFLQLLSMFQIAALQQMGKLVNPLTNEVERDLQQAKISIDMIEMLKDKTKGNLSRAENDYLDKILFELHMNYVDETNKPPEEKTGEKRSTGTAAEKDEETAQEAAPDSDKNNADDNGSEAKSGDQGD